MALSQLLPWYSDPPHPFAVVPIVEVWTRDPEFGRGLAQSLWITDGINRLEDDAIYGLGLLYDYDPSLARRLLAYASEEPVQSRNTMFLGSLNEMIRDHRDKFDQLIAQPWFTDGLNAEDRAYITAVRNVTGVDELYESLLTSPRIAQSKTISLPLAGEVNLWVFHDDPPSPDENLLATTERGVRAVEESMGAAFPLTDLIVLSLRLDDCAVAPCGAANFVDSMILVLEKGQPMDESTVYHEIAHFYLTAEVGPFWLYEGGATFFEQRIIARDEPDGEVWLDEHGLQYCREQEVPNLHALNNPNHPNPEEQRTCGYVLGLYFLTNLFNTMGEAAFLSAMRELYELYLDYQYYATDEQVFRVFLKHTPPDREAAFVDVYGRLHGGPFLDGK